MRKTTTNADAGANAPCFSAKIAPILIILSTLFFSSPSFAQDRDSLQTTLTGVVNDQDGRPVNYATVTVEGSKSSQTNEEGRYTIKSITAGSHRVTISLVGYKSVSKTVVVNAGGTTEASFVIEAGTRLPR
jgi:iron complex outermembrane receptor protein